jgi:hypothetical protein
MENRDYLMKQFDSIGEALKKLLSKILLLKEGESSDIQIAEIGDLMRSAIGLDLDDVAGLTNEAFLADLLEKRVSADDLSEVVNILVELAKVKDDLPDEYDSKQLLSKSLFLGDYLTTTQKMVYFGNIALLDEARRLLSGKVI